MMYIHDCANWKSILFVINILDKAEEKFFESFRDDFLKFNPKMVMNAVRWNPERKLTKAKEYQRKPNEWNPTDFNWYGKHKNLGIEDYFNRNYDALFVFAEDFDARCLPIIKSSKARIKVGYSEQLDNFEVILKPVQPDFRGKVEVVRQYFMLR